ncbi:MAG: ferritin family protein [Verrucomicrobiota bacterium]
MTNGNKRPATWEEILQAALRKEKAAYRFYDEMLSATRIPILRDLLETLRGEEAKHMDMIQKRIAAMNLERS